MGEPLYYVPPAVYLQVLHVNVELSRILLTLIKVLHVNVGLFFYVLPEAEKLNDWNFASFAPHALKGQKLLAQGIALGYYGRKFVAL